MKIGWLGATCALLPLAGLTSPQVVAAEFDAEAAHGRFVDAFNNRQWQDLKSLLSKDAVFHRAAAGDVFNGPEAIVGRFEQTIGGEWNVKFAKLDSESQFTGNDGRVVERGDLALTAGADDSACYAGSYLATWAPDGDAWLLQVLTWQDLETELANCK